MSFYFSPVKTLLLVGYLSLGPLLVAAQADKGGGKDKPEPPETPARDLELERELVRDAKRVGKAGNAAAVEEAVSTLNLAKKNTAEWHLETAQRLVHTAEELAREGEAAQVDKLIQRALQQLKQARQKAKGEPSEAAAYALEGFIQERYLADSAAAIESYAAAAKALPEEEAKPAAEAAQRLKRTEENRKRRDDRRD